VCEFVLLTAMLVYGSKVERKNGDSLVSVLAKLM
jgi:hypothetical protein